MQHNQEIPSPLVGEGRVRGTNLCNAAGECTATAMDEEKTCRHHTPSLIYSRVGMCILRSWYGGCMNPVASEEAKAFAKRARQAIDAAPGIQEKNNG